MFDESVSYLDVDVEVAVHPMNGARQFLLVDNQGVSMVLYGSQLQKLKTEHLEYFRIVMIKEEGK